MPSIGKSSSSEFCKNNVIILYQVVNNLSSNANTDDIGNGNVALEWSDKNEYNQVYFLRLAVRNNKRKQVNQYVNLLCQEGEIRVIILYKRSPESNWNKSASK